VDARAFFHGVNSRPCATKFFRNICLVRENVRPVR